MSTVNNTAYGESNNIDYISQVGVCLKHLPSPSDEKPYHDDNVPWQRVINSKGGISPRSVLKARCKNRINKLEEV